MAMSVFIRMLSPRPETDAHDRHSTIALHTEEHGGTVAV